MRTPAIACFFVLLFGIYFTTCAQSISYLGIEEGLSNNTVTSIYKDKFQLMWFGTLDGLNRWDGHSFQQFRNKPGDPFSLPDDKITAITGDAAGNIWVGTGKGVGVLDSRTLQSSIITYIPYGDKGKKAIACDAEIRDIERDSSGKLFICTIDRGLLISVNGARTTVQAPLIDQDGRLVPHYSVNAISPDGRSNAWLLSDDYALCYYDGKTGTITKKGHGFPSGNCIHREENGNLWIGTKKGLFLYNARTAEVSKVELKDKTLNNSIITDIMFDKGRQLWLTTDGDGIGVIDVFGSGNCRVFRQGRPGTLSSDAVNVLYEDERAMKWVGTLRGGINVIDSRTTPFTTVVHDPYNRNSLINNFTFSFCEDKEGQLWIGTDGGGVSVWNRKRGSFSNYTHTEGDVQSIPNNHITSIIKDDPGRIWVGSFGGGVVRFDKESGEYRIIRFEGNRENNSAVWKLYISGDGTVWTTCLKGDFPGVKMDRLYRYDERADKFQPVPFELNTDVISITEGDPEHLWLGTFKGLLYVDKKAGVQKTFDLGTAVRALHKDKAGRVWVGTFGKGLLCFNGATGSYTSYTEESGLCNNTVLNIEEDELGNIWCSTYNGLFRLTPSTGKCENFYASDGLQSNQFYYNASARLSSGELVFGGIKGFNIFHPENIHEVRDFPPILITGIRVLNKPVTAASKYCDAASLYDIAQITLPYDQALFSLDMVAPEYSEPEKIQYSYYLDGWDRGWNFANRLRTISYPQLREGHYVLKIRSTNASGLWNPKERSIIITVLPPWYRSWWAYVIYGVLVAAAVSAVYIYYRKQMRLQYEVKFTRELNEKKLAFFTNISHELRTPLTLIANPVKDLIHSRNIDLVDISSVYRNTQRMLSLVDQLLLFRSADEEVPAVRKERINLTEVCREVFLCFNNQWSAKALKADFVGTEALFVCADREKIEIVLFNLLSNAIKFTPDGGRIGLELSRRGERVVILVKDSGRGIPADTGARLFEKFYRVKEERDTQATNGFGIGLFLVKQYIDLHGGEISYTSQLNEGTVFTIVLPVGEVERCVAEVREPEQEVSASPILSELIVEPAETQVTAHEEKIEEVITDEVVTEKPAVLLIDDNTEIRGYVKQLLKGAYLVYEADSAEKGLEIAIETEPDVVVCDVVMSGMSGIEFCLKMKGLPNLSHIPVILLTSSTSPEVKLKGIECGADDFITKPFERELLVARIKSIVAGRNTLKRYFLNEITLQGNSMKVPEEFSDFLNRCIALIEEHMDDEEFSLTVFTREMCMSRWKLAKKVKSISGLSTTEFIRYIRLRKAAQLMIQTELQIKEIIFQVGIQDVKYFREQFNRLFGMNPSDFIRKYRGTYIKKNNVAGSFSSLPRGAGNKNG